MDKLFPKLLKIFPLIRRCDSLRLWFPLCLTHWLMPRPWQLFAQREIEAWDQSNCTNNKQRPGRVFNPYLLMKMEFINEIYSNYSKRWKSSFIFKTSIYNCSQVHRLHWDLHNWMKIFHRSGNAFFSYHSMIYSSA